MANIEEVKTFSGGMNKDDDPRFLPDGDYTDALNLTSKVIGGTAGVLTSQVGNLEIDTYLSFDLTSTKSSISGNVITATSATNYQTGMAVRYEHALGNTAISGLTEGNVYYVERLSNTTFSLYPTEQDAEDGTNIITLSSDPSGTHEFILVYALPIGSNTVVGQRWDKANNKLYYFIHNSNDRHLILQYNPTENVARLVLENNAWTRGYYWWDSAYQGAWSASPTSYDMNDIVEASGSYYMSLQESNVGVDPSGADTIASTPLYSELYWRKLDDYFPLDSSSTIITHIETIDRDGSTFLLWANPSGEPCMINVDRCMSLGQSNQYPPMSPSDVQLYANTPQWAPKVGYGQDTSLDTNSVRGKLFQFRYRYKYRSGEYSAFSPSSRIALTNFYPSTSSYNDLDSVINIRAYLPDNLTNSSSYSWKSEVESIDIFFRQNLDGNTGSWFLAQTIDIDDATISRGIRTFGVSKVASLSSSFQTTPALNKLIQGEPVKYETDGTPPTGINNGDTYYVCFPLDGSINLSTTHQEALANNFISSTTLDTGTSTVSTAFNSSEGPFYVEYDFTSGQGASAVDTLESDQLYDFIPKKAETMVLTNGNRVALGNVTHGYDWDASNLNVQLTTLNDSQSENKSRWCLKTGSNHLLGLVYSDGNGRLSNVYTNKDSEISIGYHNSSNKGASWVKFVIAHAPPSWAKYYHIVYGGNKTKSNYITFVAGVGSISSGTTNIVEAEMMSVKDMSDEMGVSNINYNYSFTEGDLIVPVYNRASGQYYRDISTIDEVHVGEVLSYDSGTYTIKFRRPSSLKGAWNLTGANSDGNIYEVYSPRDPSENQVWYEIGEQYRISKDSNGALAHSASGWDGGSRNQEVGTQSAIAIVEAGDAYIFGVYDAAAVGQGYIDTVSSAFYPNYSWAEANYLVPNRESKSTSIGRPNSVGNSQEQTYITEIDYSEPYVENTNFFGVNRFYDSNFFSDISEAYGAIKKTYSYGDYITVFQELRVSRLLSNKYFINTADLSGGVIGQTQSVFSSPSYFPQEYGCQNPESFAAFGDSMYWVDRIRGAVCRMRGGGIESISDIKMSTYFEFNLSDPVISSVLSLSSINSLLKGAYNIGDSEYVLNLTTINELKCTTISNGSYSYTLTFSNEDIEKGFLSQAVADGVVYVKAQDSSDYGIIKGGISSSDSTSITIDSKTIGGSDFELSTGANYVLLIDKASIAFNQERGRWTSRYSYNPQLLGGFGTDLVSFSGGKMYRHTSQPYYDSSDDINKSNWNRFYGTVYDSSVNFVVNKEPIAVKVPLSINVESNQAWSVPYAINNRSQITELNLADFELFEGQYWSNFLRDKYTPNLDYPLLDGDEMRGAYHEIKLLTSITDGTAETIAEAPVLFSVTIPQLYSPIS